MPDVKRIILVRHAETGGKYRGRYIGASDVPISGCGQQQSEDLAERLAGTDLTSCLISPMLRTRQTAASVATTLGLSLEFDSDLREIDFGRWEKMSFDEIAASYPEEVTAWAESSNDFHFPAGERVADFLTRVQSAGDRLLLRAQEGPALVVSHGGVIRAMICRFLGLSPDQYLLFDVQPARFTILDVYDQGAVLKGFNL